MDPKTFEERLDQFRDWTADRRHEAPIFNIGDPLYCVRRIVGGLNLDVSSVVVHMITVQGYVLDEKMDGWLYEVGPNDPVQPASHLFVKLEDALKAAWDVLKA